MAKIKKIAAREILNSAGTPTVEVKVILDDDYYGIASCPSGISVGKQEALEIRDTDNPRFGGLGVLKAVHNINSLIAPKLEGIDPTRQKDIDQILIDLAGGERKLKLGVNATLPVSIAICKAAAATLRKPTYLYLAETFFKNLKLAIHIPTPMFNVIEGGRHSEGGLDFQEFLIIPSQVKPFNQALQIGVEIYQALKKTLTLKEAISSLGEEGGYAPNFYTNADALDVLDEAIAQTNYKLGRDVFLGLDVAASNLRSGSNYRLKDRSSDLNVYDLIEFYQDISDRFRIISIEDPIAEDDWNGWINITAKLGQQILIVGDDLLVTNYKRVEKAIKEKAANSLIVKPNQVGTISETLEVIKLAKNADWKIIVSHRAGETNDDFAADLAISCAADYVKFGAPARGERVAKYNRLWEIYLVAGQI